MLFGAILKRLREDKDLKQEDVAKMMNVDRSTVGKWESSSSKPDYEKVVQLARFYNVTTDYLLGVTEGSNRDHTNIHKIPEMFDDPGEAREYVNKHQMFGSSGLDTEKLDDEEIMQFANELLQQMKMVSYKYRK